MTRNHTLQCLACGGDHYAEDCTVQRHLRHCVNCVFLQRCDQGYSNWTVTDTVAICLAGKRGDDMPEIPYGAYGQPDKWPWGEAALACEWYVNGKGPHTDVDHEETDAHRRVALISRAVEQGFAAALAVALGLYEPEESNDE